MAVLTAPDRKSPARTPATGKRVRGPRRTSPLVLAFVLVPLLVEAVWVFWPAAQGFYLALTKWDGVSPPQFVGLDNFREMAHDDVFRSAALPHRPLARRLRRPVRPARPRRRTPAPTGTARRRFLPRGPVPARRLLPRRHRPGLAGDLPARRRPQPTPAIRRPRQPAPRLARRPGHRPLRRDRARALAPDRLRHGPLPGRPQGHRPGPVRGRQGRRRRLPGSA